MNPVSALQAWKPISLVLIERKSFVPGLRARTITGSTHSHVKLPVLLNWELFWPNRLCVSRTNRLVWKTLNNDLNQIADQQFLLKQWFAAGVHSSRLRKPGSGRSSKEKYCTDITEVAVQVPFRPDFVRDFSYNCFGSARNCNDHCKIR